MLNVSHISKTFFKGTINEKKALNDLSLTLNDGDFCTVIGGNGSRQEHAPELYRRRVSSGFRNY